MKLKAAEKVTRLTEDRYVAEREKRLHSIIAPINVGQTNSLETNQLYKELNLARHSTVNTT